MLKGFARIVFFVVVMVVAIWVVTLSLLSGMSSMLSRTDESSWSSSESSPTTSIGESSSSKSDSDFSRCCAKYSALSVSTSTVIPFARNFRACRSRAFASFFRRLDLSEENQKILLELIQKTPRTLFLYQIQISKWFYGNSPFFGLQFVGRNWFARAGLRVSIVGWSTGSFLRVFPFPPLGTSVLRSEGRENQLFTRLCRWVRGK